MTRPRRVLTVVMERCAECRWLRWSADETRPVCVHPEVREVWHVNIMEPPPEWCPLPKEEP